MKKQLPIDNKDLPPKETPQDLIERDVLLGAEQLAKHGVQGSCDLTVFNYLIAKLFWDSHFTIIFNFLNDGVAESFPFEWKGKNPDSLLLPLSASSTAAKNVGIAWSEIIHAEQQLRIEKGLPPFKKAFLPYIAPGGIAHAILVTLDLNDKDATQAAITVIDPLGPNSGYRKSAEDLVVGLKTRFSSAETTVLFSQKVQQTDGTTCGFHQILNIRDLAAVPNMQEAVRDGHLQSRSKEQIIEWVKNEIKPETDHE